MSLPTGPAIGLIELCSVARGLHVCDAMVKRAVVEILRATTTHPGKYIVLIRGGVDEVHEALEAGRALAKDAFIDILELPNPHDELNAVLDQPQRPPLKALNIGETHSIYSPWLMLLSRRLIKGCQFSLMDGWERLFSFLR